MGLFVSKEYWAWYRHTEMPPVYEIQWWIQNNTCYTSYNELEGELAKFTVTHLCTNHFVLPNLARVVPNLTHLSARNLPKHEAAKANLISEVTTIEVLEFDMNNLDDLPQSFCKLINLRSLDAGRNLFTVAPHCIGSMESLVSLNLERNQIADISDSVLTNLKNLLLLNLSHNKLTSVPDSISALLSLQDLDLSGNRLQTLPSSFGELKSLVKLNLTSNKLKGSLPQCIYRLSALKELLLGFNHQLTSLDEKIIYMSCLEDLHIAYCSHLSYPTARNVRYCDPKQVEHYYRNLAKEKGVEMKMAWQTAEPI